MDNRIVPHEIGKRILLVRGRRVMLDSDLAAVYGVTTKRLKEQVRRNADRFPEDFMFRLAPVERIEVAAICGHLPTLKFSPHDPFAFTEHGAIMLASVLNSPAAIQASVQVVRAFIEMRAVLAESKELARRLDELEVKYDARFRVVFDAIRRLIEPDKKTKPKIGFRP